MVPARHVRRRSARRGSARRAGAIRASMRQGVFRPGAAEQTRRLGRAVVAAAADPGHSWCRPARVAGAAPAPGDRPSAPAPRAFGACIPLSPPVTTQALATRSEPGGTAHRRPEPGRRSAGPLPPPVPSRVCTGTRRQ